jgi:hypothetical protein
MRFPLVYAFLVPMCGRPIVYGAEVCSKSWVTDPLWKIWKVYIWALAHVFRTGFWWVRHRRTGSTSPCPRNREILAAFGIPVAPPDGGSTKKGNPLLILLDVIFAGVSGEVA